MKDWEFRLTNRLLSQCEKLGNYTEQYIHCHLRHITLPGNSPVGSCRIGAAGDPTAVVDPLLRYKEKIGDFFHILCLFNVSLPYYSLPVQEIDLAILKQNETWSP